MSGGNKMNLPGNDEDYDNDHISNASLMRLDAPPRLPGPALDNDSEHHLFSTLL